MSRVRAACVFRKSVPRSDSCKIAVSTATDGRGPLSVHVDGAEVAEVDWVAEAPSPEKLYRALAISTVEEVLAGGRASFIAHGQSGSGKTHTMDGTAEMPGLAPRSLKRLFERWPRLIAEYKPAYGRFFSDYLLGYSHWGYCDLDMVVGAPNSPS